MELIQEQGFSVPPCTTILITSTGDKLLCTTGRLTLGGGSAGDALEGGDTVTAHALRALMERIRVDRGAVEGRLTLRSCIAEMLDWYS
ncbi:hypothetical protein [Streptomyces sp. NPDC007991]|uniref:hypothetical protein n=1 Tax=Streptomyces sp. NPDC007991 TaxID=3364803 RepID=UPI0036E5FF32